MKAGLIAACLFISVICAPVFAITLKLDPDIDLIVVDGKKISSSILKGADSLELDNKQHQLVFRVVKEPRSPINSRAIYISPPLIAAFNARNLATVSFKLPSLETNRERKQFAQLANFQLIDEKQQSIPVQVDILNVTEEELTQKIEEKMAEYNSAKHPAAIAQFATTLSATSDDQLENGPMTDRLDASTASSALFSIMEYWFQRADIETQQHFLRWTHEKETH